MPHGILGEGRNEIYNRVIKATLLRGWHLKGEEIKEKRGNLGGWATFAGIEKSKYGHSEMKADLTCSRSLQKPTRMEEHEEREKIRPLITLGGNHWDLVDNSDGFGFLSGLENHCRVGGSQGHFNRITPCQKLIINCNGKKAELESPTFTIIQEKKIVLSLLWW